jgi:transposase InsO family protein
MAGECWDNAVAESFFATIKRELMAPALGPLVEDSEPQSLTTF